MKLLKNKKENEEKKTPKRKTKTKKRTRKLFSFLKKEDNYSNSDILTISTSSAVFGFVLCLFILMFITGGKNIIILCTDLKDFVKSYTTLTSKYYGNLDKKQLAEAAIEGMYSSLDDEYTTYINSENSIEFEETINGNYEGIGCTITMDVNNNILVSQIFENGPAAKTDLQIGDIIKGIDGVDYTDKTSQDLADYVKKSNKSKITLNIERNGEKINITINRQKVEIPTVSSIIYEQEEKLIGYINISSFSAVTKKQLEKELNKLEESNIDSLIIDVRYNGGGYLDSVTDIADLFLKKGEIIYQLETTTGTKKIKSATKEYRKYPIVVLVNQSSASASEILAAAIKESYGGNVVGVATYGKGTVQETMNMSDGSKIKYTTKKWLTPDGNWIDEVGLEPNYIVELPEEYYKNPSDENDAQLQKALEILSK